MAKQRRKKAYPKFQDRIKELYGEVTVYGPYIRNSDGRAIAQLRMPTGKLVTKLYAKFKLEIKLKRILGRDETVDHIDEDVTNDRFKNLRLKSAVDNIKRSHIRRTVHNAVCIQCGITFTPSRYQAVRRKTRKLAGPFCSKSCVGKYGSSVQNGGKKKGRVKVVKSYYKESDFE